MARSVYTYNAKVRSGNTASKRKKTGRKTARKKSGLIDTIKKAVVSFVTIIVLISLFLLYNWQYTSVNSQLIAIRKLEKEVNALNRHNENIKIEIKKLTHVNRVSKIAREKLGLQPPEISPVVFYVDAREFDKAKQKDRVE